MQARATRCNARLLDKQASKQASKGSPDATCALVQNMAAARPSTETSAAAGDGRGTAPSGNAWMGQAAHHCFGAAHRPDGHRRDPGGGRLSAQCCVLLCPEQRHARRRPHAEHRYRLREAGDGPRRPPRQPQLHSKPLDVGPQDAAGGNRRAGVRREQLDALRARQWDSRVAPAAAPSIPHAMPAPSVCLSVCRPRAPSDGASDSEPSFPIVKLAETREGVGAGGTCGAEAAGPHLSIMA
jgi:hypothetical protein